MSEPVPLYKPFDEMYAERQSKLAALRCKAGHRFVRRWSMHLGSWKVCRGCQLIEPIPTLTVLTPQVSKWTEDV